MLHYTKTLNLLKLKLLYGLHLVIRINRKMCLKSANHITCTNLQKASIIFFKKKWTTKLKKFLTVSIFLIS